MNHSIRRVLVLALSLSLVCLAACGAAPSAASGAPVQPGAGQLTGLGSEPELIQYDVKSAVDAGMVPSALLQGSCSEPITYGQYKELLEGAVRAAAPQSDFSVRALPSGKSGEQALTRQEGAVMLFEAARDGMGIASCNGASMNYSDEYCFQEETEQADFLDFDSLYFAASHYDLVEDARLMETTPDGRIRPFDPLTRAEAICSAWRLTRSVTPPVSYVSMGEVAPLELTAEELAKAEEQPLPTAQKLPEWRGITLEQQHSSDFFTYGAKYFGEMQVYALADLGFNFTRVPLNFYGLFQDEATMLVDENKIKNLDQLVRLGIQYGVHICFDFHSLPGYQSASYGAGQADKVDDFWNAPEKQDLAVEVFSFLAGHFKNVPSNALSFNPLNEPFAGEGPVENEGEVYAQLARRIIQAVRAQDPDRFLLLDGIRLNAGAPSRVPVPELVDEGVAQAFHYYGEDDAGDFVTNALDGVAAYSPQSWPLPFVNGFLDQAKGPLTIRGSFPAGMKLRVNLSGVCGFGSVQVLADGTPVAVADVLSHEAGTNGCTGVWDTADGGDYNLDVYGELASPASELVIRFDPTANPPSLGDYWMLAVRIVELTWPEKASSPVPFYSPQTSLPEWRQQKVTNIICAPYGLADTGASVVTVDENGLYQNPAQSEFAFSIDRIRSTVAAWAKFSQENQVGIMVQEFGVGPKMRGELANAYLDDFLTVLDEYGIPWCMYGYWGNYGIFFDSQPDATYLSYGPYQLNTEKLAVLQKHCA